MAGSAVPTTEGGTQRWVTGLETRPGNTRGFDSFTLLYAFDLSLPENQRKLDAAEQLSRLADDAGLTLIQLAMAFVRRHPAITAPIIGPRTMEHLRSQLAAADVVPTDDVLDRMDEIVPPGLTINPAENGWVSPSLQPAARRR